MSSCLMNSKTYFQSVSIIRWRKRERDTHTIEFTENLAKGKRIMGIKKFFRLFIVVMR